MPTPLRLVLGTVLAATALLTVTAPASASPRAHSVAATPQAAAPSKPSSLMRPAAAVTGQPWSAPAYPVRCGRQGNLISCTPTDPNQVRQLNCYFHVLYDGSSATICTTYEGHADAIKAAGGTPLLVDFGCQPLDPVCATFQNWGRAAALTATGMMYVVLLTTRFHVGGSLWNAAASEWSFWAWAALIVVLAATIWAITAAVVSRERDQLVTAFVRSFIAIPAVPATFWLTGHLVQAIDGLMADIIFRHGGIIGLFSTMQSVMWSGGQAGYVLGYLIFAVILLGMTLMLAVFLFRNVALAALIMVGPIAWMLFPTRAVGPQWVIRYLSAIGVLLLTGPLTLSFFSLIVHGLASVHTIWDPAAWPYLVGLALIAFAPFAVFGLFTFLGAVTVDAVGSRLGGHAAALGTRTARTAASIPTRLGARPAGMPAVRRTPVLATGGSGRGGTGSGSLIAAPRTGAASPVTQRATGTSAPSRQQTPSRSPAPPRQSAAQSPARRSREGSQR